MKPQVAPPAKREPLPDNVGHVVLGGRITPTTASLFERDTDELLAAGARAVVVHVESPGGDFEAAERMARRLRYLEARRIPSVAYVARGDSGAAFVALAASFAVTAPSGRWFIHNPLLIPEARTTEEFATLASVRERLYAHTLRRTVLGRDELEGLCAANLGAFDASTAWTCGLTDEIGDATRARVLAEVAAAGQGLPDSPRRLALKSRSGEC
jgi:ATP-dependent protease ClpP protease subunit